MVDAFTQTMGNGAADGKSIVVGHKDKIAIAIVNLEAHSSRTTCKRYVITRHRAGIDARSLSREVVPLAQCSRATIGSNIAGIECTSLSIANTVVNEKGIAGFVVLGLHSGKCLVNHLLRHEQIILSIVTERLICGTSDAIQGKWLQLRW